MPTYLLHGFRWPRPLIRIHIILQNIDDAAAEWLCNPLTTSSLLQNFHELFPEAMPHLPNLRFIEQYDPGDLSAASLSQPFAYVADVVEEVKLGVDIDEVRGRGVGNDQWGALMEIRDRLAPDEKVGWWVVVCGDEERWAPPTNELIRGGFAINQTHGVGEGYDSGLGIRGGDGGHVSGTTVYGNGNGHAQTPGKTKPAYQTDQHLQNLRDQVGYRTDSDASEESSGPVTRYTTSGTSTGTGTVGRAGSSMTATPRLSDAPPRGGGGGGGEKGDAPPSPSSTKKSGVRKWLSKRKSQRSMKELAKAQAQSRDQAPPVPSSPFPNSNSSPYLSSPTIARGPGQTAPSKLPIR